MKVFGFLELGAEAVADGFRADVPLTLQFDATRRIGTATISNGGTHRLQVEADIPDDLTQLISESHFAAGPRLGARPEGISQIALIPKTSSAETLFGFPVVATDDPIGPRETPVFGVLKSSRTVPFDPSANPAEVLRDLAQASGELVDHASFDQAAKQICELITVPAHLISSAVAPRCTWCGVDRVESAARHEGPHLTWCPRHK